MAIYHLHAGFVSRSSGRTSVQSAAYICGEKLHEDYRNKNVDYSKRANDVVCYNTLAPEHSKYKDISVWNEIESFENRYADNCFKSDETRENYKSSAQTAQTIVVALPNELCTETSKELLTKFITTRFISRGLITTYAIHQKEGNMHAHLQISRRAIDERGDFVLRKDRAICTRSALLETRQLWADLANEYLAREGFKERITEKSFTDLGIDLESTKHRGWYADIIGTDSRIAQENLEISKKNEERIFANPNIILDLLNEKKAVFTQKDILREIGKRVFEDKSISSVFEKVLDASQYVGEGINGEFLYTGAKYQKLESDVLSQFDNLSSQVSKTVCNKGTISSILSKYNYLSNEQKDAVKGLTKDDNVGILLGKAGAGKTTIMKAISAIYEQNGARVIGMSLSAVASENLGKDADIESHTIASWSHKWRMYETAQERFLSFNSVVTDGILKQLDWYKDLKRYENSQLKSGDVIVVDEAGMVGTSDWQAILNAANKFGAKVVAVGDDNQFKPISAGDCFRNFVHSAQNIFELNEIRRQKEDWQRNASVAFSKLNTEKALAQYESHGNIHAEGNNIHTKIAEKFLENSANTVVLCATNKECSAINDTIRFLKQNSGELGKDIAKINGRNFAKNDSIIFLQNNKYFDVKNGQIGSVKSFENGILSIQTEVGMKNINVEKYDKLEHAYAITLHKSQGKTYDNTIVFANKMMDAKAYYVGMTRHRENVNLYYNTSEISSFKALISSAAKYQHKDSLEDYRERENKNKSRVFEYKETLLEISSVLRDINRGEAEWKEYHSLKANSIKLGNEILSEFSSHKLYLSQLGITREKFEKSLGIRQSSNNAQETFLKNIEAMKIPNSGNKAKVNIDEFIGFQQNRTLYKIALDHHKKTEGYGLYANNAMLEKYLYVHNIKLEATEYINKYASMLVQKTIDEQNIKEVSVELLKSSIKQAICFESFMQVMNGKEITSEITEASHEKAIILADRLTDDNIRVLNNQELITEANSVIKVEGKATLTNHRLEQLIELHQENILQQSKSKELSIEKTKVLNL